MRKADITTRGNYYARPPAVNVKVYNTYNEIERAAIAEGLPEGYVEKMGDDFQSWWDIACEMGVEDATEYAREMFGPAVRLYLDGRSGGWLIVEGLPDVESWDAIMVNTWARFARFARSNADAIPESAASLIYLNVYEREQEERQAALDALDVPDWRVALAGARQLCNS